MRWADPALAAATLAATCAGASEFVSDPAMCGRDPIDTQEMGLRLDATGMWTIETTCQWDVPVDLDSSEVQVRPGYCSEPGLLFPGVFAVLRDGDAVLVYEGPSGEPQVFTACPE